MRFTSSKRSSVSAGAPEGSSPRSIIRDSASGIDAAEAFTG